MQICNFASKNWTTNILLGYVTFAVDSCHDNINPWANTNLLTRTVVAKGGNISNE